MRTRILFFAIISTLVIGFASCSKTINADFTYSPLMPKAGEKITFTNISSDGSVWDWHFGDDYISLIENPTHVYLEPGTYDVTLRVDSNNHSVKTKQIIVYDTIPTIQTSVSQVNYYTNVTFSALAYNPYLYDVTYRWTFSSNAHGDSITDGVSTAIKPIVYFSQKDVDEIVKLHITVGDSVFDIADTVYINDVKAQSILMAQKNGNILRQRIFDKGLEEYTNTNITSGKHPFNLSSNAGYAYIFDAGTTISYQNDWQTNTSGDGNIRAINLTNDNVEEVINNNGLSSHFGFFNGSSDANYLYWTDYSELVYKIAKDQRNKTLTWNGSVTSQSTSPYYLANVNSLEYSGNGLAANQFSGGIFNYDDVYFWAKGGTGKGIYRFETSDLNSGTAPEYGAILTDYSIRAFTVDQINHKIYFSATAPSDKVGLWVSNIDGTNAKLIDDAPMDDASMYITGIVVDNTSNKVYWAYRCPDSLSSNASYLTDHPTHRTGVKQAKLATLYTNAGSVEYFALGVSAYGLALDQVKK